LSQISLRKVTSIQLNLFLCRWESNSKQKFVPYLQQRKHRTFRPSLYNCTNNFKTDAKWLRLW